MKRSRTKLNALIDALLKDRLLTEPGNDGATVTQDYLNRLSAILRELIDLSHEGDYKGRHGIYFSIRSYSTHENGRPDMGIDRLPENPTSQQVQRALEVAVSNVEEASQVVKELVRGMGYRREVEETQS